VFGGTSGIGLATCGLLVAGGADVVAFGRSEDKFPAAKAAVAAAASSVAEGAGAFDTVSVDILDRDAMAATFASNTVQARSEGGWLWTE
jgi:NAD(P)-dependent dehydrogenase (short-subunit alcohol dehydrogenase family)